VETVLALAAAALYGSADFLGGTASRRASTFGVLVVTVPAGAAVMLAGSAAGRRRDRPGDGVKIPGAVATGSVVAVALVLEDQPADFKVKLLGIGQVVYPTQRLVLAGRLDDELSVSE
jgi:hypothetical protein